MGNGFPHVVRRYDRSRSGIGRSRLTAPGHSVFRGPPAQLILARRPCEPPGTRAGSAADSEWLGCEASLVLRSRGALHAVCAPGRRIVAEGVPRFRGWSLELGYEAPLPCAASTRGHTFSAFCL